MQHPRFVPLAKMEDLKAAFTASYQEPVVLFKHSITCSVSMRAEREMQALDQERDPKIFQLIVQRSRNLSYHIADTLNIQHESPQIIILQDGKAIFNTSHGQVRAQIVRDVLQTLAPV
mgnify:CR=1 FL=1